MNLPTTQDLSAHYEREFAEMGKFAANMAQVLADCAQVDAEEKAAKLPIDVVIGRVEALLDAADGASCGALQTCLESLQSAASENDRIMADAEEIYEQEAMRGSSAVRKL